MRLQSQTATTCTSGRVINSMLMAIPCRPMPIQATVILSLGAVCPWPPSTCRGTMVNAAAAAAKLRRVINVFLPESPDSMDILLDACRRLDALHQFVIDVLHVGMQVSLRFRSEERR